MSTEHPITPPQELVREWKKECSPYDVPADYIATQAARWGADQELEACCDWLLHECSSLAIYLRTARRPKPPSLAEQALDTLRSMRIDPVILNGIIVNEHLIDQYNIISAALKRLQELENNG